MHLHGLEIGQGFVNGQFSDLVQGLAVFVFANEYMARTGFQA